jgi:signal transduction histidine kinase
MEDNLQIALDTFTITHGKFDVVIEKDYDPKLEKILAAPQAIARVFVYIIDNSLYALLQKHKQGIADYKPTLSISITKQNENTVIRIKDNGTGIPKKSLDKVFEPFFTTKPTGKGNTGLGLSICYDTVVKQHKGELRVTSEEGVFTEFTIVLPINIRKSKA